MISFCSYCKDHSRHAPFLIGILFLFVTFGFYSLNPSDHIYYSFSKLINLDHVNLSSSLEICPTLKENFSLMVFVKPVSIQMTRMETMLLPSLEWFWLHQNSEIIFVTDKTNIINEFISNIKSSAKKFLSKNFKWTILFNQKLITKFTTQFDSENKLKQIPKFWSDNFTNSEFIGIVDADTLFVTPVMASDLFVDGKPVMRGTFGCPAHENAFQWAKNVEEILNLTYIGQFMDYFPVIVRRKDLVNIRNFIVKQNNLSYFDEIFDNVNYRYSEYTLMANYLWYFEHENYYWVMENATTKCKEMLPVTDSRVYQYAQRRLPPVSIHWSKVQNHLKINKETVFLNGICYADRSLWPDCLKRGIPIKESTQSESIFYDRVNFFEWFFEHDFWPDNDPETALRGHRRRMEMLGKCKFHWNYTDITELFEKYQDPLGKIHDFLYKDKHHPK